MRIIINFHVKVDLWTHHSPMICGLVKRVDVGKCGTGAKGIKTTSSKSFFFFIAIKYSELQHCFKKGVKKKRERETSTRHWFSEDGPHDQNGESKKKKSMHGVLWRNKNTESTRIVINWLSPVLCYKLYNVNYIVKAFWICRGHFGKLSLITLSVSQVLIIIMNAIRVCQ